MFQYFDKHWFLSLLFMLIVIPTVAYFVTNIVLNFLRTINVIIRGWPPEHLDASGDALEYKYEDEEEKENDDNGS